MCSVNEEIHDNVNHPKHYKETSLECIETMIIAFGAEAVAMNCCINCYKYLFRYMSKNGIEDLKKAKWYLNKCKEIQCDYHINLPKQFGDLKVILKQHLLKAGIENEE